MASGRELLWRVFLKLLFWQHRVSIGIGLNSYIHAGGNLGAAIEMMGGSGGVRRNVYAPLCVCTHDIPGHVFLPEET